MRTLTTQKGGGAKFRLGVAVSPLDHDYERLPETLAGLHILAFATLMVKNVVEVLA